MTEAVEVVTDHWLETLKFPVLRAPKAIAHTASRRISEKQGMRVVAREERDYISGRLPAEIWEITADEGRARRKRWGHAATAASRAHPEKRACRRVSPTLRPSTQL